VQNSTKFAKPSEPAASGSSGSDAAAKNEKPRPGDLGIAERRHFIRPLPVPDAVESDRDTDWDTFQTLNSELPKD
jgi:hypothetical protein